MTDSELRGMVSEWLAEFSDVSGDEFPDTLSRYLAKRIAPLTGTQDDPDVIEFTWNGEKIKSRVVSHGGGIVELADLYGSYQIVLTVDALKKAGVDESRLAAIFDRLGDNSRPLKRAVPSPTLDGV